MNRQDYMKQLATAIEPLGVAERQEILKDIAEHFDAAIASGVDEQDVAKRLGSPEELAATYLEQAGEQPKKEGAPPPPKAPPKAPTMYTSVDSGMNTLWGVLFLIFGLPILAGIGGCYMTLWGLVLAFGAAGPAVLAVSVGMTGMAFTGLLILGISFVLLAVGFCLLAIGLVKDLIKLGKWYVKATHNLFRVGRITV